MTTAESIIEKNFKTVRSKIELNAYLPALAFDMFYFIDPEMAEKISKEGIKQIKKLQMIDNSKEYVLCAAIWYFLFFQLFIIYKVIN